MSCIVCKNKSVYPGSQWCSNTCRFSGKDNAYNNTPQQGQPLCRICNNAAFFDSTTKKFAPGCTRSHTQQALSAGFHSAR